MEVRIAEIIPISLREANRFIEKHHRHSGRAQGCKFCVALSDESGVLHGVAVVGRSISRYLDDGRTAEVTRLCRSLNGRKTLVLGNHDTQSPEWYRECGFVEASAWPIIIDGFWILSHEPLYINENMPYANIYGHVHGNPTYKDFCRQSICVCVERTEYRPISFEEIRKKVLGN